MSKDDDNMGSGGHGWVSGCAAAGAVLMTLIAALVAALVVML